MMLTTNKAWKKSPTFAMNARLGLLLLASGVVVYLTTDWKRGEVRRLANWLSEEE